MSLHFLVQARPLATSEFLEEPLLTRRCRSVREPDQMCQGGEGGGGALLGYFCGKGEGGWPIELSGIVGTISLVLPLYYHSTSSSVSDSGVGGISGVGVPLRSSSFLSVWAWS